MVTLSEIKYVAKDAASYYLNDIRLRTRLGMGTCQGTFCSLRAIAALENENIEMKLKPSDNIKNFLLSLYVVNLPPNMETNPERPSSV